MLDCMKVTTIPPSIRQWKWGEGFRLCSTIPKALLLVLLETTEWRLQNFFSVTQPLTCLMASFPKSSVFPLHLKHPYRDFTDTACPERRGEKMWRTHAHTIHLTCGVCEGRRGSSAVGMLHINTDLSQCYHLPESLSSSFIAPHHFSSSKLFSHHSLSHLLPLLFSIIQHSSYSTCLLSLFSL